MQEAIKRELSRLGSNGMLTPERVVDAARNKKSPLHKLFKWDLREAAQAHWLHVARNIIREYQIVVEVRGTTRTIPVKAFVHDPEADAESQYISTVMLQNNPLRAIPALQTEARRANSVLESVRNLAEYWGYPTSDIDSAMANVQKFITKLNRARLRKVG